ncbi:hypothetical protein ACSBR1_025142 [Camellia fascicularis]
MGRSRNNTWIQALGLMFDSHSFTLSANKVAKWDDQVDQFHVAYNSKPIFIHNSHLSIWTALDSRLVVEHTAISNSVILSENVEGVLGQTYWPDFKGPVKRGVPMPVVGGEDKFQTSSSLVSADCRLCIFMMGVTSCLAQEVGFSSTSKLQLVKIETISGRVVTY